jgi:hypothetical protein
MATCPGHWEQLPAFPQALQSRPVNLNVGVRYLQSIRAIGYGLVLAHVSGPCAPVRWRIACPGYRRGQPSIR